MAHKQLFWLVAAFLAAAALSYAATIPEIASKRLEPSEPLGDEFEQLITDTEKKEAKDIESGKSEGWQPNEIPPFWVTKGAAIAEVKKVRELILAGRLPQNFDMNPKYLDVVYCVLNKDRWEGGRRDVDLDLHGFRKVDAVTLAKRLVARARRLGRKMVSVDTGKGNHSPGGAPVLQPAVEYFLIGCQYEYTKRIDHLLQITGMFDMDAQSPDALQTPNCLQ